MAFKMKGFPLKEGSRRAERKERKKAHDEFVPAESLKAKGPTQAPDQPGRKEVHNGKDVYPSLADARKQISAKRIEMVKGGASEAELKAFDTHANERLSELSKKQ